MKFALVLAMLAVAWPLAPAAPTLAASPAVFETPTADVPLGGPYVFKTGFTLDAQPKRVELLLTFPGQPWTTVLGATTSGGNGHWQAEVSYEEHILPNSLLHYRFRVTGADGAQSLGPDTTVLTADDRFDWQTVTGPVVRLHWYGADAAFGQRALDVGEKAVQKASDLLGVAETDPIDFYIYNDEQAFRAVFGPGLRENVAGTAIASIRTMFAFLLPSQIDSDFVNVLVTHELTHLVFDTATENIYHSAPHWLNEGIAVYLSEGVTERWQSDVDIAIGRRKLIPLQGMPYGFGAGEDRFELGYAEAVMAVDFFVRTYTEEKLWALVRSYAQGVSNDDAFRQAIGVDVAGFNAAWMNSLNYRVPDEVGPRPGPTGPLPPDWQGLPPATPGPTDHTAPPVTRPTPGTNPGEGPGSSSGSSGGVALAVLGLVVAVVVIGFIVFAARRRRRPPPPPPWWQGPAGPPPGPPFGAPPGPPPPPPPGWDAH